MANLLLAEHGYQVVDFINRGFKETIQWIALGPSAMACLDDKGFKYYIPEDFYESKALQLLCSKTHDHVEWLCRQLDMKLFDEYPNLKQWDMQPFLFNIIPIIMLFDSIRSRMFQLQAIIQAFPGTTLYIHEGTKFPWTAFGLGFSNEETLWGHVAALHGWDAHIELIPDVKTSPVTTDRKDVGFIRNGKLALRKSFFSTTVVRSIRAHDYAGLIDLICSGSSGTLLMVGGEYDWKYSISHLRKHGFRILFVQEETFKEEETCYWHMKNVEWPFIEKDSDIMRHFQLFGVSYYPLLKERFIHIYSCVPLQFKKVFNKIQDICVRFNVRAVLRAATSGGVGHAINQASRFISIPVFVWQHGAVMDNDRISQSCDYIDRMTADVTFVYGEGPKRAYTTCSKDFKSKVVPVGSASLDAVQSSCKERTLNFSGTGTLDTEINILYATTSYYQNHWYYGAPPGISDRYFCRDQWFIISSLRKAMEQFGVKIVIKLYPGGTYQDPPWIEKFKNCKGIRIVKEEADFLQLLPSSNAVILDYPSTTLLQTIAAGLPLFVLMKYWEYPMEAKRMLSLRAVLAEEPEDLMIKFNTYCNDLKYAPNLKDDLFLKSYGTYLGDGNSAERAIKVLLDKIKLPSHTLNYEAAILKKTEQGNKNIV